MTAENAASDHRCPLLSLPVELRLAIYSYAILDSRCITIGVSRLRGAYADVLHRQYGHDRSPYPGIPQNCEPSIESAYCPSLLSATAPAVISLTPGDHERAESAYEHTQTAYYTLLRLNRQINNELKSHFSIPARRETSLFVQFPYGLHILHTTTPQLLRQSRSVHLAGTYFPRYYDPSRAARLGRRSAPNQEKLQGDVIPESAKHLEDLVRSCFGSEPRHKLGKLEMRIYYPGENSYGTVWGDDDSPIVVALRNVALGEISIECFRGRHGTGMYLTVSPMKERKRTVSTVWRRLEEGRRGEPACGTWIVDPHWPEWKAEYQASEETRVQVS